jgi:hypothetical protein
MGNIQQELSKLEDEIAKLGPGTNPDHLNRIDAELSKIEKVITKQDEEDDFDPDDDEDGTDFDDGDGVDSDGHRTRKAYSGGDDDEEDDDGDDVPNPGRRRLFNQGQPQHYQPDLTKAYGNSSSNGSPLPVTHKWEATVQNLAAEHGVPLATASVMARKAFPRLWISYQQSGLQDNAARSHQALITERMDKGHSELIAKQQVAHLYGSTPIDLMKGDTPVTRFNAVVTKLMQERGIERTEALRLARKRNPTLFAKYCEC